MDGNLSEMISRVMSDPELIKRVSGVLSGLGEQNNGTQEHSESTGQTESEHIFNHAAENTPEKSAFTGNGETQSMGKTPMSNESMEKAETTEALLVKADTVSSGFVFNKKANEDRIRLLTAIKPFLSPEKCRHVDQIIRLLRLLQLGDLGKLLSL